MWHAPMQSSSSTGNATMSVTVIVADGAIVGETVVAVGGATGESIDAGDTVKSLAVCVGKGWHPATTRQAIIKASHTKTFFGLMRFPPWENWLGESMPERVWAKNHLTIISRYGKQRKNGQAKD